MNILAMLQFSIAVGVVLAVAMWVLYWWLRRTGRLRTQEEKIDELFEQAARNQGFASLKELVEANERTKKPR